MQENTITPEVFSNVEALNLDAVSRIIEFADKAIIEHDSFSIALAGGSTPKAIYEILAGKVAAGELDISKWKFFMGDERLVSLDNQDSNFKMVNDALFSKAGVNPSQIYSVDTSISDPEKVARSYEEVLRTNLPINESGMPIFDLVLLGMGSDGHTASLFPGKPSLKELVNAVVVTEHGVLPPPVNRITLTLPVINAANGVLFLVTKADKHPALEAVLQYAEFGDPAEIPPAALVNPHGSLIWLVDSAAMNG